MVLLGTIGHVMILMNGYWDNAFLLSAILVIAIPIAIHKFRTPTKQELRKRRITAEI